MNEAVLEQKKQTVQMLSDKMKEAASTVVVEYRGLNVAETTELRRALRAENVQMGVFKNSLVSRALESLGYNDLAETMVGPNALVFGDDAVAPARLLAKFAKTHKALVLKTGLVEGKVVDADKLKELSSLPNKEGMISMFMGCLQSPIGAFARVVKAVSDSKPADGQPVETKEVVEEKKEEVVVEEAKADETANSEEVKEASVSAEATNETSAEAEEAK